MTNTPRIWTSTVIIACGVMLSPFAAPILQLLNYRSAGENKDVINSALWVLGMLICVIAFPFIPLSLSSFNQMVYSQFLALLLVVVWFFLYGRWFPTRISSVVLKDVVYRSPFSAIFISLGVMAVSFYFIGFLVRFLKHI